MLKNLEKKIVSLPTIILLILSAAIYVWSLSANTNRFLCIKECGEAFIAQHQVQNFRLYGFKYLLLEDHSTSNDDSQHPYFYTHNANIGAISFQLMDFVGIKSFSAKQACVLIIFSIGLLYVYLAIELITKSKSIAFLTLLFSIMDINQILAFSLNALRAWHWLAIFGLLYHVGKYAINKNTNFTNNFFILFFMFAAFSIGYDFFGTCVVLAVITTLFFARNSNSVTTKLKDILFIGLIASVPFIFRQIQVAYVMGLNYWAQDFYYSFVIKIPFVVKHFPLDYDALNNFYLQHNVLRPPASPAGHQTFAMNLDLFMKLFRAIIIPEAGFLSVWLFVFVLISPIIYSIYWLARYFVPNSNKTNIFTQLNPQQKQIVISSYMLLAAIIVSITIGLLLFLPFSFHVYFKHQFPLIAVPLHFAKAIFVTFIFFILTNQNYRSLLTTSLIAFTGFIFVDHAIVHILNSNKVPLLDTNWIHEVQKEPNASYAVSWIPNTVAGFVNNWVVGIKPGIEEKIAKRYACNQELFTDDDLLQFGQRNESKIHNFLKPDYWLYFTTDQITPFDTRDGHGNKDYLLKFLRSLCFWNFKRVQVAYSWISKPEASPGSILSIGGHLKKISPKLAGLYLSSPKFIVTDNISNQTNELIQDIKQKVSLNLDNRDFYVEYTIPHEFAKIMQKLNLQQSKIIFEINARFVDGTEKVIAKQELNLNTNLPKQHLIANQRPPEQPSVTELSNMMKGLPIKAQGDGYIIFDLKNTNATV